MPEDGIPGGETCDFVQGLSGRDPGLGDGGRLDPAKVWGFVEKGPGRDDDVFGVGAAVGEAEDLVAFFEVVFVRGGIGGGEGGDNAGEFNAEDSGGAGGDGVVALALDEVHAV